MLILFRDLSGGQIPNFRAAYWLNTVKLSQNQLSGPSPPFYNEFAGFGFVNLTRLLAIDLSKNSLIGSPPDFIAIPTLQYVNFSGNGFENLIFHPSISNVSSDLQVLDLSQNKFNGSLPDFNSFSSTLQQFFNSFEPMEDPAWLSNLTQLQKLSLKGIGLFGSFPYNLASQLTKLEILELDNNNFNGTLHKDNVANLRRRVSNGIKLQNNPDCLNQQTNAQTCYCNQICIIFPNIGKRFNVWRIIAITILIVQPTIFPYDILKATIKNFQEKLGEGQFGIVYKGKLHEQDVAVKKVLETNTHNLEEFINEVTLIPNVSEHKNLVKFLGCCYTTSSERFLVCEYVENNDLHETLFNDFSLYQTSHAISTTKTLDDMNA
ncbi:unnamed protein product [Sphagnum jensenii]|uniref:Protein kinase domain-containing protein n=1 Tax=Sphagnum jensenii TaxID=128206 RepID=A0ABP1B645_9BRYO